MFAPQTNPASPAVLSYSVKNWFGLRLSRIFPLPLKLFPVYRWDFAVSKMLNFVTLGFCSDASRVGQRTKPLYYRRLAIFAALNRSIAAPIPPRAKAAGFLGVFYDQATGQGIP